MPLDASVVFCPPLSSDPAADAGGGDLPLPPVMEAHSGLVLHALVRVDGSGFADLSQVGLDGGQLHGHEPGVVVLPFTGVTALILLFVILTLANHEKLEQEVHLAGLREVYYQGIQREQVQVRTLRHDLRNHMTVLRGLLESGETEKAIGYLEQITDSSSLGGGKPFSDNETANVVLTAKAKERQPAMETGGVSDFPASKPFDCRDGFVCPFGQCPGQCHGGGGEKYRQDGPGSLSGGKRPVYAPGGQCTGWG